MPQGPVNTQAERLSEPLSCARGPSRPTVVPQRVRQAHRPLGDTMDHCTDCETQSEEYRCPTCGMTGKDIAAKRRETQ
jgi:hypothetical protein